MARFLVFTLAAPLTAFGDVAPGERRVGLDRPGRSALLGLIAAALGLRREDERHGPLAASLAFAVRVDAVGHALVDYHTTQTVPAKRNRRFATRREELAVAPQDRVTILSQRSYRADAAFTVAALPRGEGPFGLEAIADALARPRLPIHAGRRSCPLALPPSPRLLEAPDLPAVFRRYDGEEDADADRQALRRLLRGGEAVGSEAAVEAAFASENLLGGAIERRRAQRRDDPVSRTRWQFTLREDIVVELPA